MINEFVSLFRRVSALEKRVSSMVRHGPVEEVNASEGWVRINLGQGDDGPLLSPKIPYAQMAGALKVHAPPSEGQNMTIISPAGDMRQAFALPMTWSDQNVSPSNSTDENVLTFGSVRIEVKGDQIKAMIGGFSLTLTTSAATFAVDGVEHKISGDGLRTTGGAIEHNDHDIGSTHKHGGVVHGGELTDPPV
jgi:phage baseplate assembly protein gpV